MTIPRVCILLALCGMLLPGTSVAVGERTLRVGPGEVFRTPAAAALAAQPGDLIEIAPGSYTDCAVWPARASGITIRARDGGPVVMSGSVCGRRALFVVQGDNVTIRGITFTGAKSLFHNGAGIRAEGRNLTIDHSQFLDNEEGILAAPQRESAIVIRESYFRGNGNCILPNGCGHGVYVNQLDRLVIERCTFFEQHVGHHVKSRASRTEILESTIEDGPEGTASYLVDIPNGGTLVMRGNKLEKGPKSENSTAAVSLGEEGNTNVTAEILIENNEFSNDMGVETIFVRNFTPAPASVRGNVTTGDVRLTEEQHFGDR